MGAPQRRSLRYTRAKTPAVTTAAVRKSMLPSMSGSLFLFFLLLFLIFLLMMLFLLMLFLLILLLCYCLRDPLFISFLCVLEIYVVDG